MKKVLPAFLAVIMAISLCACGGGNNTASDSGSTSSDTDAIIGHWEMIATCDQDNSNEMSSATGSGAYVEFNKDGSGLLYLDSDAKYNFDWAYYPELTAKLDDMIGYSIDFDTIPNAANATLSESNGTDTVIILVDDIQYGMVFQK